MALASERHFSKCVHNLDIRINYSYVFGFKIVYVSCCDTQSGLKGFNPDILNLSKACVVSKLCKYRRYLILHTVMISKGTSG